MLEWLWLPGNKKGRVIFPPFCPQIHIYFDTDSWKIIYQTSLFKENWEVRVGRERESRESVDKCMYFVSTYLCFYFSPNKSIVSYGKFWEKKNCNRVLCVYVHINHLFMYPSIHPRIQIQCKRGSDRVLCAGYSVFLTFCLKMPSSSGLVFPNHTPIALYCNIMI